MFLSTSDPQSMTISQLLEEHDQQVIKCEMISRLFALGRAKLGALASQHRRLDRLNEAIDDFADAARGEVS